MVYTVVGDTVRKFENSIRAAKRHESLGENFLNLPGGRLPEQRPLAEFHRTRTLWAPGAPVYTTALHSVVQF